MVYKEKEINKNNFALKIDVDVGLDDQSLYITNISTTREQEHKEDLGTISRIQGEQ